MALVANARFKSEMKQCSSARTIPVGKKPSGSARTLPDSGTTNNRVLETLDALGSAPWAARA